MKIVEVFRLENQQDPLGNPGYLLFRPNHQHNTRYVTLCNSLASLVNNVVEEGRTIDIQFPPRDGLFLDQDARKIYTYHPATLEDQAQIRLKLRGRLS